MNLYLSFSADTQHVPADEISAGFQMSGKQWKVKYRCEKPGRDDVLILVCRTNKQASWVAQLAHDNGLQNCFVYKQVLLSFIVFHLLESCLLQNFS